MLDAERDRAAYALAKEYLLSFASVGVTPELLESYVNPKPVDRRSLTIPGIYQRILGSAANRGRSRGVIFGGIEEIEALAIVLCDFNPSAIIEEYGDSSGEVLNAIETKLRPRGRIRTTSRSIWPLFCRTIVTGASFMNQFRTAEEFCDWVDVFDSDDLRRPALPMLLDYEIAGFGFALACDFLKELGYFKFGKPDVHLKTIFKGLGLTDNPGATDYEVFKAITRVARHQGVLPYNVDKLFWLVGSGYFHNDKDIGALGRVHTNRKEFIEQAKAKLSASLNV